MSGNNKMQKEEANNKMQKEEADKLLHFLKCYISFYDLTEYKISIDDASSNGEKIAYSLEYSFGGRACRQVRHFCGRANIDKLQAYLNKYKSDMPSLHQEIIDGVWWMRH